MKSSPVNEFSSLAAAGGTGELALALKKTNRFLKEDFEKIEELQKILAGSKDDRIHFFEIIKLAVLQTLKTDNAAASSFHLKEDKCENFDQFLDYLKKIPYTIFVSESQSYQQSSLALLLDREAGELKKMVGTRELLESPDFFTNFLLNFKQYRTLFSCLQDHEKKQARQRTPSAIMKRNYDLEEQKNFSGIDVCYSEIQGCRKEQEDTFFVGTANISHAALSASTLQQMFLEFGEKISHNESGSTALLSCLTPDGKLTIANLGDSRAVLFVRDKKSGEVEFKRLTNDSDPADIYERGCIALKGAMVAAAKGLPAIKRVIRPGVKGGLSMTKAFGDAKISAGKIIDYSPDLYQYQIDRKEDKEYFLCLSCDGCFNMSNTFGTIVNEDEYAKLLKESKSKDLISKQFKNYALAQGARDNITVMVANITKNPRENLIMGIFDGHNGAEVSSEAALYFGDRLLDKKKTHTIKVAQETIDIEAIKKEAEEIRPATSVAKTGCFSALLARFRRR